MTRSRTQPSSYIALVALVCTPLLISGLSFSAERETKHLFTIQRSKNANVVQYDVQLTPDGKLDPKEPVIAYWVMLAEDGRKEKLMWIERAAAYGFKAKYEASGNFVVMDMVADIRRTVKVRERGGIYRAETLIDGQLAYVEKIYVKSTEGGAFPTVEYIELSGCNVETGNDCYEKVIPK